MTGVHRCVPVTFQIMRALTIVFLGLCVVVAALFVRLGFWQLARLKERQALNAEVAGRMAQRAVPVEALPRDTAGVRFRHVIVRGTFDYAHEVRLAGRSHEGSPGVHILTPVRLAGSDAAVLVNRGWAYSPDGATLDMARWREDSAATVEGFVELFPPASSQRIGVRSRGGDSAVVMRLEAADLARRIPYPILPYYVVRIDTAPPRADRLATIDPPSLDEGPHLSYAIQWFSFAAIALIGGALLVRASRGNA